MMDLFTEIEEPERKELKALRKELEEANYKYYVRNMPTLSDREFDEKMHRLQALEAQFPDMFDPKSPTQHVGSDLDKGQRTKDKTEKDLRPSDTNTRCCRWRTVIPAKRLRNGCANSLQA